MHHKLHQIYDEPSPYQKVDEWDWITQCISWYLEPHRYVKQNKKSAWLMAEFSQTQKITHIFTHTNRKGKLSTQDTIASKSVDDLTQYS